MPKKSSPGMIYLVNRGGPVFISTNPGNWHRCPADLLEFSSLNLNGYLCTLKISRMFNTRTRIKDLLSSDKSQFRNNHYGLGAQLSEQPVHCC